MAPIHAHPAGMRINVVNNHQAKQVECVCEREKERERLHTSVCFDVVFQVD